MQSTIGLMWLSYKKQYVTSRSCYRWKDCWGWKRKVFPSWQLSSLFPLLSLSFQAPRFSFFPLFASLLALICWFWKGSVGVCLVILVTSDSATLWTVAHLTPLSMGFSRQEYWSGLPDPPPGDRPDPGIEPTAPALQADSSLLSHPGSPRV